MMMRFRTRAFLICFIPFAVLLTASFWMIQRVVQSTVRDGLRESLRANQLAIGRMHAKNDLQNSRFLRVVGENAGLKAGMQLLLSAPRNEAARMTVEDQLRELGQHMGFDFLLVSAPNGMPLAGVVRNLDKKAGDSELVPISTDLLKSIDNGLVLLDGRPFQVGSVPIDQNDENIGALTVGEFFNFSEFTTPAVLIHNGKVITSNFRDTSLTELNTALSRCADGSECDLRIRGANWISLPVQGISNNGGYSLRSLQNVDTAILPIQSDLRRLFLTVALGSVFIAFACSVASSRSIVKPIAAIVAQLRSTVRTGVLPEFESARSKILEVRELADSYNRAAGSVRKAQECLQRAYIEFVGSLAHALEARDPYTAGHSHRVSELSCAIAAEMGLDHAHIEQLRIGALLHDIGKIGIADTILQKAGRLTEEEFAIIKEHPAVGRQILEGVQGFAPFLPAVELHHENWDGTGYPKGQSGEETPVDARIIHVADAYDAMTSNRSYRSGMGHEKAIYILRVNAGTQFDPKIVELLTKLPRELVTGESGVPEIEEPVSTEA